jgi:hypothetical protein
VNYYNYQPYDITYTGVGKKGKVILVLNYAPRHEDVLGKWRCSSTHSLNSTLDGGEWSASRPGRFIATERTAGTHWIGGWVGPRADLEAVLKRKLPRAPAENRTPIIRSSSPQSLDIPTELYLTHYTGVEKYLGDRKNMAV